MKHTAALKVFFTKKDYFVIHNICKLPHHNCTVLQALDFLQQNARQLHFGRTKLLPVSGAFHTELMASAAEPLREVLRQVEVSKTQVALLSMYTPARFFYIYTEAI